VDQHQREKDREAVRKEQPQDRKATHEVTKGHELLGRKVSVRKLIGKEDAQDRGNGERAADPRLLYAGESDRRHVGPDQRKPGAPDEELEHHHHEELISGGSIHGGRSIGRRCGTVQARRRVPHRFWCCGYRSHTAVNFAKATDYVAGRYVREAVGGIRRPPTVA
jgi:hypothetical protein